MELGKKVEGQHGSGTVLCIIVDVGKGGDASQKRRSGAHLNVTGTRKKRQHRRIRAKAPEMRGEPDEHAAEAKDCGGDKKRAWAETRQRPHRREFVGGEACAQPTCLGLSVDVMSFRVLPDTYVGIASLMSKKQFDSLLKSFKEYQRQFYL